MPVNLEWGFDNGKWAYYCIIGVAVLTAKQGLVCGSNCMLTPEFGMALDNLSMLGKDSRCYSFDHRANGYARGEGFGVLVIKNLNMALRDGDTIRAVIRSSCSNQDGKTPSVTMPDRDAQERLIHDAYAKAGLDLGATRYFEAHGTGRNYMARPFDNKLMRIPYQEPLLVIPLRRAPLVLLSEHTEVQKLLCTCQFPLSLLSSCIPSYVFFFFSLFLLFFISFLLALYFH